MPLLVGIDGTRKMSKSLGNQIGITDPPQEMYGKAMSIPDGVVGEYRRLLLDEPRDARGGAAAGGGGEPPAGGEVQADAAGAPSAGSAARDAKRSLARDLVAWLYSEEDAAAAAQHFERVFVSARGAGGDRGGELRRARTATCSCRA